MADKSFLDWPFFDDRHRELAKRIDDWASRNLGALTTTDVDAALPRISSPCWAAMAGSI